MDRSLSDRFSRLFFSIASIVQNESSINSNKENGDWRQRLNGTLVGADLETGEVEEASHFHVSTWVYVLMTSLYACIFVLGVSGNLLVILVIAKDRRMRTTANFYLISLSVADLMIIAFCLPVAVYELHAEEVWNLGPVLCKLAPLLQYLSTNASISTMVAISIERFLVVCRPLKIRTYCTKTRACGLIIVLWLFSLACSSPVLYFTQHEADFHHKLKRMVYVCYINHLTNEGFFYFHQLCFYLLPGLLLSFLYCQIVLALREFKSERFGHSPDSRKNAGPGSKAQSDTKQLIFMLSIVVLSYFVFLLPYNCITFLSLVSNQTLIDLGPMGYNVFLAISRIMFFVNSCSNPITYNAISGKFRDAFKKFFCPRRFKSRGIDSRTISIRSARALGADEDHLLNRRFRTTTDRIARSGSGHTARTAKGAGTGTITRGSLTTTGELEKESARLRRSESCSGRQRSSAKLTRSGFSTDEVSAIIRRTSEQTNHAEAEL